MKGINDGAYPDQFIYARSNATMNLLPFPTSLSHHTRPPIISVNRFTTERPTPVDDSSPVGFAERVWNFKNSFFWSSLEMPGPSSLMPIWALPYTLWHTLPFPISLHWSTAPCDFRIKLTEFNAWSWGRVGLGFHGADFLILKAGSPRLRRRADDVVFLMARRRCGEVGI